MLTYQRLKRFEAPAHQAKVSRRDFRRRFLVGMPLVAVVMVCGCFYAKNAVDSDRRRLPAEGTSMDSEFHKFKESITPFIKKCKDVKDWNIDIDHTYFPIVKDILLKKIFDDKAKPELYIFECTDEEAARICCRSFDMIMMNLSSTGNDVDAMGGIQNERLTVENIAQSFINWDRFWNPQEFILSKCYAECKTIAFNFCRKGWVSPSVQKRYTYALLSGLNTYLSGEYQSGNAPRGDLLEKMNDDEEENFYNSMSFNLANSQHFQISFGDSIDSKGVVKAGKLHKRVRKIHPCTLSVEASFEEFTQHFMTAIEDISNNPSDLPDFEEIVKKEWNVWRKTGRNSRVMKERATTLLNQVMDLSKQYRNIYYDYKVTKGLKYDDKDPISAVFHIAVCEGISTSTEHVKDIFKEIAPLVENCSDRTLPPEKIVEILGKCKEDNFADYDNFQNMVNVCLKELGRA